MQMKRIRSQYLKSKICNQVSLDAYDSNNILGTSIVRDELPEKAVDNEIEEGSDEDCCLDSEDDDKNQQLDKDGRPEL